ncbi:RNase H family protein [Bacillus sp. FJAT-28004]|uniref:RNase H family protein n=1 Tax=Bacillus sp. FJAT-28004 TaxID=1679165 RepID=UPI0006B47564|nr:RNase H family protein [Bacillus sp. FJAT-28004]
MDSTMDVLIKKAYANPGLRQNIVNKGMICLYCDYSGFVAQNNHGAGCCFVFNRTIRVTAQKIRIEHDEGSNYGELLAVIYSLEILSTALMEYQPKLAIIFTDCSQITKILSKNYFSQSHYEKARDEILASLQHLKVMYPEVEVQIKYMSKHKKNNSLHRLAHNAARQAAVQ